MAIKVNVRYDNIDKYERIINAEVRQGIIDMAKGIQGAAQSVAPVETGFMRDNIFVHPEGYPKVTVSSEADYSGYVEYGTRDSAAQPFMRPAYEQSRVSSINHLEARLARRLAK